MAVDFCDYFWGEKHDGFQALYHNMKYSVLACKDLTDVVRETAVLHEYNAKAYGKISKQLGTALNTGTFAPMLAALKTSSDKLYQVHNATLGKINELMKELIRYNEELHKKHKQIKDEEAPTSDVVKSLQDTTLLLQKSKEFYKAKTVELERLKRENPSPKELEKVETKFRKAQEDYKHLVDKYTHVREEFEKKMLSSCKHFQQAETLYLTQMVDFVQSYHELIDRNHNEVGKVNLELEENLVQNTVEKMLEQFVLQKYTGLVRPGPVEFEEEKISLTSLNAAISGGPPSDISDRSANSDKTGDKVSTASLNKKESTGFLKGRKKKERSKKGKGKEEGAGGGGGEADSKEIGSDGEERGRSETPTPDQLDLLKLDEDRYSQPVATPPVVSASATGLSTATDPWADFHQPKKSFYSSSESDSDEEIKKIKVNIRPVNANNRSATSASVDELQKAVGGIDLTMATLPKRFTPTIELGGGGSSSNFGVKRSQSTNLVGGSRNTQDLAGLFSVFPEHPGPSDVGSVSGGLPAAESTRLDTSNNSNSSKEVSDLLSEIQELTTEAKEPSDVRPPSSAAPTWPGDGPGPPPLPSVPPPSEGATPWSAGDSTPWPDPASWGEVQPAVPPKQNPRPASVQRERVANSLISLPRPPSRARPEPRMRGTPSPTPSSLLQTTVLSIARSDSTGSNQSAGRSDSFGSKYHADFFAPKVRSESLSAKPSEPPGFGSAFDLTGSGPEKTRSDSLGSLSARPALRAGPLLAPPIKAEPQRPLPPPRSESPSPPAGPPPPLITAATPTPHSFATSRGPSPLTLAGVDVVPLAVAFQEVVHAAFRGSDESRCLVKLLGDMMLSFPAGIVGVLASNPYPAPLQFRITNAKRLESVLPNKQLISKVKNQCTEDILVFEFNMNSLQELLNKQSQINPSASYFNIDILKYQVAALPGAASCPFQMVSYWKCEREHTDLRLDFKYNQHAMARTTPLLNVTLAVPVDGGVMNMTSQPKGVWNSESGRALWKFPDLSANQNGGVGAIRARFQLSDGPGSQSTIAAQFNCEGTTLSGVEFELTGPGYRVSLVKRRFVSGKYVSEPDYTTDKYRYAAPPSSDY